MSIDIHFEVMDELSLKVAASIFVNLIQAKIVVEDNNKIIQGIFNGGDFSIYHPTERGKQLCDELYGITPQTIIGFRVDKSHSAAVYYENILGSIIALVKATNGDAVACEEERVLLRRLNGKITLYNDSGLFDPDMKLNWRQKFDFDYAFKEKFER